MPAVIAESVSRYEQLLALPENVFTLQDGYWLVWGLYRDNAEASAAPFQDITLALADLWVEVE